MSKKGENRGHCQACGSVLVLNVYPDMHSTVNAIRGLVVARDVIKARPVIK